MPWEDHSNFFAGNDLHRLSEKRTNKSLIQSLAKDASSRFILFNDLNPLMEVPADVDPKLIPTKSSGQLAYLKYEDIASLIDLDTNAQSQWVFLGLDETDQVAETGQGRANFAIELQTLDGPSSTTAASFISSLPPTSKFLSVRPHTFRLDARTAAIVGTARAVLEWNQKARFCPSCGRSTVSEESGWKRICRKEVEGEKVCVARKSTQSFTHPRTDNSIIVAIVSADGQRLLLGRKHRAPPKFFSCVAGFQEPGETLEECVRREAKEETGVDLGQIVYHSSQPWPFPSQLMLGFVANVRGSETVRPEEDEFAEARWFTKEEILTALDGAASGKSSFANPDPKSDLVLAPPWAVAHHIIKAWAHNEVVFTERSSEGSRI